MPLDSGKLTTPRQSKVFTCPGEMNVHCPLGLLNSKKFIPVKTHTVL